MSDSNKRLISSGVSLNYVHSAVQILLICRNESRNVVANFPVNDIILYTAETAAV